MKKKARKRFSKFINKNSPLPKAYCVKIHPEIAGIPCEEWNGCCDKDGYGVFQYKGKSERAHRRAFKLKYGKIPKGMAVCHKCDNPPCTNWLHLFTGDNDADRVAKNRQAKGSKHGNSKLIEKDVIRIRRKYASGKYSQRELARKFGIVQSKIWDVIHRKTWRHL